MSYRDDFKREFFQIRPGFEDDLEWFDDGMRLLGKGKLKKAERRFKQLTLSQPQHPDGLEGLARTYQAMGQCKKALIFINDAIKMTDKMVTLGYSDREILQGMYELREEINRMSESRTN